MPFVSVLNCWPDERAAYRGSIRLFKRDTDFEIKKSDTETGVWLMRGAQPATSAGARLFAGSPIPALLPSSMGRYRDQKDASRNF
jgi:hypothetical protein